MRRKACFFSFLCCLFAVVSAFSEIRTIHTLEDVPTHQFSKKTLVMFDVDDVLLYPKDALLQNWRSGWKPEGVRDWTAEEDTIAWMNVKFQIMDPYGPTLINWLNENEIPTIGFTAFSIDPSDIVESIPTWRSLHLKELGLHFKREEEIVLLSHEGFLSASFEKGVLYCGNFYRKDNDNKGKILSLFLDKLDWIPDLVILVDDGKSNVESVGKELERRGIPYLGFLYVPKELDPINAKVAELQYRTLIDQKVWLSDSEAKRLLLEKSEDLLRYESHFCLANRRY